MVRGSAVVNSRRMQMLKVATKCAPEAVGLEQAHRAGFRAVELWLGAGMLADYRKMADVCGDYPFEYVLHFPNEMPLPDAVLEQVVFLYRALNCRAMVIHQQPFDKFGA